LFTVAEEKGFAMPEAVVRKNPFDDLQKLLERAGVPSHRRGDIRWIDAHLHLLQLTPSNRRRVKTLLNKLMFRTKPIRR
jgi:hypothetical protein